MSLGVQLFLAVAAFGGTWVALHFFSSRIVDYQEIIKWLEQRDWVRFIKPRIRNFLLQRAWQPLLALIITSFIFSRLETPATFLAEGCFPQAPQFLYLPEPGQDWLDFRTRELTMVGRSQELEDLNGFLNRKGRFSWWWLNGGGGSGKSRLALEWVLSLRRTFIPCGV